MRKWTVLMAALGLVLGGSAAYAETSPAPDPLPDGPACGPIGSCGEVPTYVTPTPEPEVTSDPSPTPAPAPQDEAPAEPAKPASAAPTYTG